jgi:hypothetical protein
MAAIIELDRLFNNKSIAHNISLIWNESLVTRARNRFANTAAFDTDGVGRKFSHLLLIDSDVTFDPQDILKMLEADKPICALPFARKNVQWPQIAEAARLGVPDCLLENFVGDPCINHSKPIGLDGIQQIGQTGTACMLINTKIFHAMAEKHPDWKYRL